MRYPPAPTSRPRNGGANINEQAVLRICDRIGRGISFGSACSMEFVANNREVWKRYATEKEAFWVWALECVEYAEANFVGRVEEALGEVALVRDNEGRMHKDAVRAQQAILNKRSEIYAEAPKQRERASIAVTIDKLQLLLQGGTNPSALVGAAFPTAVEGAILDMLPEHVEDDLEDGQQTVEGDEEGGDGMLERAPVNVRQPPPTARAFAFRRKGDQ